MNFLKSLFKTDSSSKPDRKTKSSNPKTKSSRNLSEQEKLDIEESFVMQGMEAFNNGNHSSAVSYFDKALDLNPNNAHIWLMRSGALSHLNREQECIDAYYKARSIDPSIQKPGWLI